VTAIATAHVARQLLGSGTDHAEAELVACTYSPTINVCLGLADGYRLPKALADVYGVLVPGRERQHIAAISIERNKAPDRSARGELLEVFLSGDSAAHMVGDSDADVLAAVSTELERYLPGVTSAITMTHLIRWPHAEPRSPIGRARAVAEYRATRANPRMLLAGDYVALPWTDGAADAGAWAAATLIAHLD
jgi:protoporphyrinogen/coproporphyrinogen III oxidase